MAVWVIFLEYPFPGKVGSELGEEKPITSIRWTTQFVRVRRISDIYNPTFKRFLWEMHHKSTVFEILPELSEHPTGEVCVGMIKIHWALDVAG